MPVKGTCTKYGTPTLTVVMFLVRDVVTVCRHMETDTCVRSNLPSHCLIAHAVGGEGRLKERTRVCENSFSERVNCPANRYEAR
jgi:hypothetical protein